MCLCQKRKGIPRYYRTLYILVNHKLPSCLEYCDAPHVPYASALLEHVLKPLHFTYSSCSQGARQYVFAGFMEEFISSPFTDQIFQFFIPALADARCSFPFEPFLHALLGTVSASLLTHVKAPWLLYFVLAVGETHLGQCQSSMMPFTLLELVSLSRCLRDACLGIIQLAYPETKPEHREEYIAAFKSVGVKTNTEIQQRIQAEQKQWIQLFKVRTSGISP
ncbi:UNVERIFIED_CONTAM: hypothetical protein FKN15_013123 [Acipenser sinensis]